MNDACSAVITGDYWLCVGHTIILDVGYLLAHSEFSTCISAVEIYQATPSYSYLYLLTDGRLNSFYQVSARSWPVLRIHISARRDSVHLEMMAQCVSSRD